MNDCAAWIWWWVVSACRLVKMSSTVWVMRLPLTKFEYCRPQTQTCQPCMCVGGEIHLQCLCFCGDEILYGKRKWAHIQFWTQVACNFVVKGNASNIQPFPSKVSISARQILFISDQQMTVRQWEVFIFINKGVFHCDFIRFPSLIKPKFSLRFSSDSSHTHQTCLDDVITPAVLRPK